MKVYFTIYSLYYSILNYRLGYFFVEISILNDAIMSWYTSIPSCYGTALVLGR